MKVKMQERRQRDRGGNEEQKDGEARAAGLAHPGQVREAPATGLEAMMGLDDMGELEIPEHLLPGPQMGGGGAFGAGAGGMSEEDMIAAAIAASLKDQEPAQAQN